MPRSGLDCEQRRLCYRLATVAASNAVPPRTPITLQISCVDIRSLAIACTKASFARRLHERRMPAVMSTERAFALGCVALIADRQPFGPHTSRPWGSPFVCMSASHR
jgi:hypothetical protein